MLFRSGFFSPFAVYLLTKYMRRIPVSVMEAAQIDGAGEWQIFRRICMPLCKGCMCSIAILLFIDYWNMVEQPLILLSDQEKHPLSVFLSKIKSGVCCGDDLYGASHTGIFVRGGLSGRGNQLSGRY